MRLFLIAALPVAFVLYGHGLQAPFYLDDNGVLETARNGLTLTGTRPLGYFSFYLSVMTADAFGLLFHLLPSFYYRLANLLIHVLASMVLFGLSRELTRNVSASYAAGFLFLVHPIVSQPVMYVTQRFESLAVLLMFASAGAYARFRRTGGWGWLAGAVGFGVGAGLTKEIAVILPAWILLMEFTYFRKWGWDRRFLYFIPLGAVLAWPAWTTFRGSSATLTSVPVGQYWLTQGLVLLKHLQLVIYPAEQYLLYDFPLATGLSWPVVGAWSVVLSLLATGILLLNRHPTIGFGILTFFVLLLPVTLLPLPDTFFEHRVYGAFGGLATALGSLVATRSRGLMVAITVVLLVPLGIRTFVRSAEWNDDVRFYETHRVRFPDDPQILTDLAVRYYTRGDVSLAQEIIGEARLHEGRFNAFHSKSGRVNIASNLISFAAINEDYEEAGRELDRALALHPSEPRILLTAGTHYLRINEPQSALRVFQQLTEVEPTGVSGWAGMGEAYAKLGNAEAAEEALSRVSTLRDEQSVGQSQSKVADTATILIHAPRIRATGRMVIFILLGVVLGSTLVSLRWAWVQLRLGT